jgi:hypothetical protein
MGSAALTHPTLADMTHCSDYYNYGQVIGWCFVLGVISSEGIPNEADSERYLYNIGPDSLSFF